MILLIQKVNLAVQNTGYEVYIPAGTRRLSMKTRDGTAFRIGLTQSIVEANTEEVYSVPTSGEWAEENLDIPEAIVLYAACAADSKILEAMYWKD